MDLSNLDLSKVGVVVNEEPVVTGEGIDKAVEEMKSPDFKEDEKESEEMNRILNSMPELVSKYNKFNLLNFTDKKNHREIFRGIQFTKDYTQSTDSYKMIRVGSVKVEHKDLPKQLQSASSVTENETAIIPIEQLEKFEKLVPNKSSLPILNGFYVNMGKEDSVFTCTDLESVDSKMIKHIDAEYPDMDQLLKPARESDCVVGFNPDYMIEICNIYKKLGKDKVEMRFKLNDDKKVMNGIYFKTTSPEDQEVEMILMPMKVD